MHDRIHDNIKRRNRFIQFAGSNQAAAARGWARTPYLFKEKRLFQPLELEKQFSIKNWFYLYSYKSVWSHSASVAFEMLPRHRNSFIAGFA